MKLVLWVQVPLVSPVLAVLLVLLLVLPPLEAVQV